MRDGDLGRFLRSRREATSPADVGLPVGPRRRTPGLRRAELATLAGISVDYLTRIEQGRDTRPSAQILAALAHAMRLTEDDMQHLRALATISSTPELCPSSRPLAQLVRPTTVTMLEALEPNPAFVLNRLADVLAWNAAYWRVAGALGILDGQRPNIVRYTFADPRARRAFVEWEAIADEQVGNLQAGAACGDPSLSRLVGELTEQGSAEFTSRWEKHPVAPKRTGTMRLDHPDVGEVRLNYETLQLPDADEQRLIVYFASDATTSAALDRLNGRYPGGLRAVSE